jgi:NAD-dependent SIR2 family protein deacetylase
MDSIITTASESVQGHKKFIHFYCVKCRDHFKSNDYEDVTFKNGKNAIKSKCETCGTASYLIVKNK